MNARDKVEEIAHKLEAAGEPYPDKWAEALRRFIAEYDELRRKLEEADEL